MSSLLEKLQLGRICLGTVITFTDPTITEALCDGMDFLWIDMEHNALSLESVQAHLMATKGSETTALVRVPWNDPVLIKPVLDIGAAGVIVPLIRTAEDASLAVAACRYPPEGVRGYGPRRPSGYGRRGGPAFCHDANERVLVFVQIEHIDAIHNLQTILDVPGLSGVLVGCNDLAGSMGHPGEPRHPDVLAAAEAVLAQARERGMFPGIAIGDNPEHLVEWAHKGAQWLSIGADYTLLLRGADSVTIAVRAGLGA